MHQLAYVQDFSKAISMFILLPEKLTDLFLSRGSEFANNYLHSLCSPEFPYSYLSVQTRPNYRFILNGISRCLVPHK